LDVDMALAADTMDDKTSPEWTTSASATDGQSEGSAGEKPVLSRAMFKEALEKRLAKAHGLTMPASSEKPEGEAAAVDEEQPAASTPQPVELSSDVPTTSAVPAPTAASAPVPATPSVAPPVRSKAPPPPPNRSRPPPLPGMSAPMPSTDSMPSVSAASADLSVNTAVSARAAGRASVPAIGLSGSRNISGEGLNRAASDCRSEVSSPRSELNSAIFQGSRTEPRSRVNSTLFPAPYDQELQHVQQDELLYRPPSRSTRQGSSERPVYTTWHQKNLEGQLNVTQGELREARAHASRLEEEIKAMQSQNTWLKHQLDIQNSRDELLQDIRNRVSEVEVMRDGRRGGVCKSVCSLFGRR